MSEFKIKNIINYINEYFSFLIEGLGFVNIKEEYDDQYFSVTFQSKDIRIRIEEYHRGLSVYAASIFDPEEEASVFNIIDYLNRDVDNKVEPNYYNRIKDLNECYKKQAEWLAKVVKEYHPLIKTFYDKEHYKENSKRLNEFVIKRNPELFKQVDEGSET